jgi:exosome complex RNA-binding protein Rrp4
VDIIIGTNGYIWMTETPNYQEDQTQTPIKQAIINETKEDTTEHVHVSHTHNIYIYTIMHATDVIV